MKTGLLMKWIEDNYSKLVDAYKGVFPGRFDTFEKLRRKSLDDVDFHIKEMKEKEETTREMRS